VLLAALKQILPPAHLIRVAQREYLRFLFSDFRLSSHGNRGRFAVHKTAKISLDHPKNIRPKICC
ncbi:hypothetical protein, partial [Ralstonia solanacearum]|uniref:hypothetical protein n=1 Tax=Ralstonia solanacearum TaxID=305 RepID=UPI001E4031C8